MDAFVFPGQGSQHRGMGGELFDSTEFQTYEEAADRLLGYSLRQICLENPNNVLKETQYTQPCLYAVNALNYYKACAEGRRPSYLAGHSLGEYNALLAADAFDFITGLQLVTKRGALMAQAKDGAMAAVIGLTSDRLTAVLQQHKLTRVDIANYNAPKQIVISGPADDIASAKPLFEKAGAQIYFPLPVSAAFHSRQMTAAAAAFSDFLDTFAFDRLKISVISNVTGEPYPDGDPTTTVRSLLVKQIVSPVQWLQTIQFLMGKGVQHFSELGPGNVLSRLILQIKAN
jgi:malonyl CoA-acyl carrier protein transacylase